MTWRLMKVLPDLLEQPDFAPVKSYLRDNSHERDLCLATKLADLFDQYQNYRADWLESWAQGQNVLIHHDARQSDIPADQRWQPQLWRAVLATLQEEQKEAIRPRLHQRALQNLRERPEDYTGRVARRVIVFGMSYMPTSTLQALAALSPYTQVILAIPNPCRYYWGDIMEGRELFKTLRKRQQAKPGADLADITLEDMHNHAHPLLASWGRQGRDFIRLLDEFDNAEQTQAQFKQLRIDLFDDSADTDACPMLLRMQHQIRDLEPIHCQHQNRPLPLAADDHSIVFHIAHSRVRELEILHDQLLHLLDPMQFRGEKPPLHPRDIVVMVPDIEVMAPAIRAVFEQYTRNDPRYIPYDIADVSAKSGSPAITALEWLLKLPYQRCGMSELVDILEVPSVSARFGIAVDDLPQLTQWMAGAGIRWGLNEQHRSDLGLQACGEQNSAWFGLQRLLLGYAAGDLPTGIDPDWGWGQIAPYTEVGGLDAERAGGLAHLLQALIDWVAQSSASAAPPVWAERGRTLLNALFKPSDDTERAVLALLNDALATWLDACDQAGFSDTLVLADFRLAWLEAIEAPSIENKFRAGGVTFCTLMPMRAVPFEVVCLLGMNDGDYPRRAMHSDFDLMREVGQYRPGDRSRQHDDRQLMLEAVLSARRTLYIGWTGRSVRDNSEQPPSVLVSQLRDYLAAWWGKQAVKERTTEHPLQPFSRRYFENGTPLLTHAREWHSLHRITEETNHAALSTSSLASFSPDAKVPLTLNRLTQFLRNPVRVFFRERLSIVFDESAPKNHDVEPFTIGGLEHYQLVQQHINSWQPESNLDTLQSQVAQALQQQRRAGVFQVKALGERQQTRLQTSLENMAQAWVQAHIDYPHTAPRQVVRVEHNNVVLEDWIDQLRTQSSQTVQIAWLRLEPGKLASTEGNVQPNKLLAVWVRLLAAAAIGHSLHAVIVSEDARLDISPMEIDTAQAQLPLLLDAWLAGMQQPLPVPFKTALAVMEAQKGTTNPIDLKKAVQVYEGNTHTNIQGEGSEPCLARQFPDFEALQSSGQLQDWAVKLYGPLSQWAKNCVKTTLHTIPEPATTTPTDGATV